MDVAGVGVHCLAVNASIGLLFLVTDDSKLWSNMEAMFVMVKYLLRIRIEG